MEDWLGDWLGPWFEEALLTEPGDRGLALVVGAEDSKPVLAKWDGFCTALEAGDKVLGLIVGEEDGKPIIAWSDQICEGTGTTFEVGKKYFALVVGEEDGKPILASFCKQCEESEFPPALFCDDCTAPDEIFVTFEEDPQVGCKFPETAIALTRCSITAALCGIFYRTTTYTRIGGSEEDGWIYDEGVVTDDNAAGIECLESVYGVSGAWFRVKWYCWSSEHIDYPNGCCTHDNFPSPGTYVCVLTTGGTLFYMITVFEHSDSTDAEDFDAGIQPEDTLCCEFLWACSETGPYDDFCFTDLSDCGLVLEGMHPINFFNGHARRYNATTGLYGGGCGTSPVLPCVSSSGSFENGDLEIVSTSWGTVCGGGFNDTGATDGWFVCELSYSQGSLSGVPLSPGPANDTCEPFYREWGWSDGPGGVLTATVSE